MTPRFHDLLRGFCRLDCDRISFLKTLLDWKKIPYERIRQGGDHLLVHPRGKKGTLKDHYTKVLTAHVDRAPGTPGANDNSASVFGLLGHMETLLEADFPHNSLVLFTDQEELVGGKTMFDQGAYRLGQFWKKELGEDFLFVVFDMCGIGDTLVWGRSDRKLRQEAPQAEVTGQLIRSIDRIYTSLENLLFRYSRQTDMAVNDLFSDDLGFILSGLPAVQFSLLPWKEAVKWKEDRSQRPGSWERNHSPEDRVETLQETAFRTLEKFLKDLSRYQIPLPR